MNTKTESIDTNCLLFPEDVKPYPSTELLPSREYKFLASSNREEHIKLRGLLNRWFADFPADEKKRKSIRRDVQTAARLGPKVFELYLYQLLSACGAEVIPEPDMPNGNQSRPDFLVRLGSGYEFYLEAFYLEERIADYAAPGGVNALIGFLMDRLPSVPAIFSCSIATRTKDNPRPAWTLQKILDLSRAGAVEGSYEVSDPQTGWTLMVRVKPLPSTVRGNVIFSGDAVHVPDNSALILRKLQDKRGQHKDLDKPLAYALGFEHHVGTQQGFLQACFGIPQAEHLESAPLWAGANPSRATFVLGFIGAAPMSYASTHALTICRPGDANGRLLPFSFCELVDGNVLCSNGVTPAELLSPREGPR